jgi:hypothetical protein
MNVQPLALRSRCVLETLWPTLRAARSQAC